jgi:hypothetical protein
LPISAFNWTLSIFHRTGIKRIEEVIDKVGTGNKEKEMKGSDKVKESGKVINKELERGEEP